MIFMIIFSLSGPDDEWVARKRKSEKRILMQWILVHVHMQPNHNLKSELGDTAFNVQSSVVCGFFSFFFIFWLFFFFLILVTGKLIFHWLQWIYNGTFKQ